MLARLRAGFRKCRHVWVLLPIVFLAAAPASARATVNGGCTATAKASKSGSVDLTTADVWHLRHEDVVNGEGKAPAAQTFAQVQVVTFGIGATILDGKENSQSGTAGPYKVSDYDRYTRVLLLTGKSNSCDGSLLIIVDDVNPLATLAGVVGVIVGVLALLGMLATLSLAPTFSSRAVGVVLGLLAGLGLGEVLQQVDFLDPRSWLVIALPAVGVFIGAIVPGLLYRGGVATKS